MHQGYAFALAFKILLDEEDARDTVQESFLSVWKHLKGFDSHCKFTTWLYSIVVNRAKDRLKSNMRRRQVVTRNWGDTDETISGEPLDCALANKELAERIGVDEPRISDIMHGKIQSFTLDRLVSYGEKIFPSLRIKIHAA